MNLIDEINPNDLLPHQNKDLIIGILDRGRGIGLDPNPNIGQSIRRQIKFYLGLRGELSETELN